MSIIIMKKIGINIFYAQMYYLILWELNGGKISDWVNKYSACFRIEWESLPEPKKSWWSMFIKKHICDWEVNNA